MENIIADLFTKPLQGHKSQYFGAKIMNTNT